MRTYDEIYDDARETGPAFSNGTGWELWQYNVCMGAGRPGAACVHDENQDCPLIVCSLNERIPAEWVGPHERYRCTERLTETQRRREERKRLEAERKQAVEESHYPMFETGNADG